MLDEESRAKGIGEPDLPKRLGELSGKIFYNWGIFTVTTLENTELAGGEVRRKEETRSVSVRRFPPSSSVMEGHALFEETGRRRRLRRAYGLALWV